MARRRPPAGSISRKKHALKKLRSSAGYGIEALESRTLFVVLHGGDVFEFFAENTFYERVAVTGNTTVELVGGRVDQMTGAFSLTTMQGVVTQGPDQGAVNGGFVNAGMMMPMVNDTIFAMYVSQSDVNSSIAVAMVPNLMTVPRPMQPYTGSIGQLRVRPTISSNVNPPLLVNAPDGSGMAVLGARTVNPPMVMNQDNIPITSAAFPAGMFSTIPTPPGGAISAGLTVAPGLDLGYFLFGGTIMGQVNIPGSVQQFYAGWLLTGRTRGEADINIVSIPHNFTVGGDLRDLITPGPIGTEGDALVNTPDYVTGFDMIVGGALGELKSNGDIIGNVDVTHSPTAPTLAGTPLTETETRGPGTFDPWDPTPAFPGFPQPPITLGTPAGGGNLPMIVNDTFANPQYVAPTDTIPGNITISGTIEADPATRDLVDYYAVPLLAGQAVTVQLTEPGVPGISGIPGQLALLGDLDVGVFDPDQRLIATDYNRVDPSQSQEQPFQFRADRPGVYRIAVGESSNNNFDANGGAGPIVPMDFPYQLQIQNVGNLAIGGIVAAGNILDNPDASGVTGIPGAPPVVGIHAANGDIGAVVSSGEVISNDVSLGGTELGVYTFRANTGNLRDVDGNEIGFINSGAIGLTPTVSLPAGSVGLLRATGPVLAWNLFVPAGNSTLSRVGSATNAIAGDYQVVDVAGGTFLGDLVADGNIGTIRASDMATNPPSYLQVNADYSPTHSGTIDLIDVKNQIGTLGTGGPAIITGPGGNVRYIHLGPFGTLFRDNAFGGQTPEPTPYQPGEAVDITDDSGSIVHLVPVGTGATPNPNFNAALPADPTTNPQFLGAILSVLTYPIRGSGGAAVVKVDTENGIIISSSGAGSAEIGTIQTSGTGTAVVLGTTPVAVPPTGGVGTGGGLNSGGTTSIGGGTGNPTANQGGTSSVGGQGNTTGVTFAGPGQPGGPPVGLTSKQHYKLPTLGQTPSLPAMATPLTLTFSGPDPISVFEITSPPIPGGDGSLVPAIGQVTAIENDTRGEIVNIHLNSLGTLATNGTVGVSASTTGADVLGLVHTPLSEDAGASEPWDYPLLQPRNLVRVLGNIVSITASHGIGNVYAGLITTTPPDAVPLVGTPEVPAGGLLAGTAGNIGLITGHILAPIVAAGTIGGATANGGFAGNGTGAVGGAGLYAVGLIGNVVSNGDFRGVIVSNTGQLGLTVNGSIIGGTIANFQRFDFVEDRPSIYIIPHAFGNPITFPTLDIGGITVNGPNGIIGTLIAGDHIGPIVVSSHGFGFFDSRINMLGEGTLVSLTTGGYGIRASTINGGASLGPIVALGDGTVIPTTGFTPSVRTSDSGVMFDPGTGIPISFLNDIDVYLGTTSGTHMTPHVSDTGVIEDSTFLGSRDLTSVSAWAVRGRDLNQGLSNPDLNFRSVFTLQASVFNIANRIGSFTVKGPVNGLNVTTGRTSKFRFVGDVAGLDMTVAGPIGNLVFNGSLLSDSFINATGPNGKIGSITIHGSLEGGVHATQRIGQVRIDGNLVGNITGLFLGSLKLGGGIGNGSLTIDSNVGSIVTLGNLGVAASALTINGSLGTLKVGGNLNGTVLVQKNLRNLTVKGSILSGTTATVGGILNSLFVGGDVQAGAVVHAQIIKKKVIKGKLLGSVLAP
jgi:hypothetical protein